MTKTSIVAVAICLALGACREQATPETPAIAVEPVPGDPLAAYPAAGEGTAIQPIDPAISPDAAAIDQRADELETQSEVLDPEQPGWEPRIVRGWFDQGRLVRLSVTEPTSAGGMSGESIWYLAEADPFLVRAPEAIYKLDRAGQIVEWLQEDGSPADVTPAQRSQRSLELSAAFQRWNDVLQERGRDS